MTSSEYGGCILSHGAGIKELSWGWYRRRLDRFEHGRLFRIQGLHESPIRTDLHLRLPVRHCRQAVLIFIMETLIWGVLLLAVIPPGFKIGFQFHKQSTILGSAHLSARLTPDKPLALRRLSIVALSKPLNLFTLFLRLRKSLRVVPRWTTQNLRTVFRAKLLFSTPSANNLPRGGKLTYSPSGPCTPSNSTVVNPPFICNKTDESENFLLLNILYSLHTKVVLHIFDRMTQSNFSWC